MLYIIITIQWIKFIIILQKLYYNLYNIWQILQNLYNIWQILQIFQSELFCFLREADNPWCEYSFTTHGPQWNR